MLIAVVAALIALVVAAIIVAVIFILRHRNRTSNVSVKRPIRSISSVGTNSTLEDSGSRVRGTAEERGGKVATSPDVRPSDGLRSRFIAIGVLFAAVFGTLTARLWSMQVLMSDSYTSEAEANQYATMSTPAPRGLIFDTTGMPLVQNRSSLTVLADADVLDDHDVIQRLSTVLGIPYNVIRLRLQDTSTGAQGQRVIASDVNMRDVAFIAEHSDAFSGVDVETRTVRDYPYGALAAQVLGYTGTVSEDDMDSVSAGRDIELGDEVGKMGIEEYYDDLLSGDHGQRRVIADANGNVVEVESETQPTKGSDLYLTIAAPVQYLADKTLAELVAPSDGVIGTGRGVGAACVAMDVRTGAIVAMANYPVFAPEKFIGGITEDTWDLYSSDKAYNPLLNRVIGGLYPPASTFKAFTSLAALAYGFATTETTWTCSGSWDGWDTGKSQNCWLKTGHGTLDLHGGIVNSCDTVFYEIAKDFWDNGESQGGTISDTALQDYVKLYHFGELTGIDLKGEAQGRVPTPEWKAEWFANQPEEAQWQGGDMTNMIIGQGYVLATPIQLAVAYGAVATGNIMKPHLLQEVHNSEDKVVSTVEPEVVDVPDVPAENLEIVRDGLRGVATENNEDASLFSGLGIQAACKTGTAEYSDDPDTAWFACYAPYDDPHYVVTCVVEHGGAGAAVAGPVGAKILAACISYEKGKLDEVAAIEGSTGESRVTKSSGGGGRTD